MSARRFAQVALDLPVDKLFDYLLPAGAPCPVGVRVVVPFAAKKKIGVVVAIASESAVPAARLKAVERVCDDAPPFAASDLALFAFCRDYYHEPLGQIILSALPPGLRRTLPLTRPRTRRFQITPLGMATKPEHISARAAVRRKVLQHLQSAGSIGTDELLQIAPSAAAALRFIVRAGLASPTTIPVPRAAMPSGPATGLTLNAEQQHAFDAIASDFDRFTVWLLKGVTGSGKTEVYLRLVQQALARGGQALLLVPEINLTPQLEAHVAARFPDTPLASLHSQLSERERVAHWLAIASGGASIIL